MYNNSIVNNSIKEKGMIDMLYSVNELDVWKDIEGYEGIYLKQVSGIYQKENTDLIDYFFY